ncbi:MAG TPA: hypothetical protein DCY79_15915 [Planctomycetaceae bacterium]|nr:hypothetical protein [Blastopirellula sp.]HAY81290.1 hypothetical protein [Planctomycetaceae bacterium]
MASGGIDVGNSRIDDLRGGSSAAKIWRSVITPSTCPSGSSKAAEENGVAVVERKPLARALYAAVDIGQVIPVELYQAVAEVLSYVWGRTAA